MRLDRKISSLELLTYRHYRIVHGVRIGLAFILTFLLIRLLAVPEGTWPLITLVVVMGPISFWGNVLQRALQRIAGTVFGAASGPVTAFGTADLCLFMRTLHGWMAAGIAEKAFADAFAALRPGGVLGVEQHRLAPAQDQDPVAANGYVQEAFVRQLAAEAGFVFVEASEINANPDDTKDHPFGVDTLAPTRLTAPRGEPADPAFDRSKYDAIGESDRMTLKFRKPE